MKGLGACARIARRGTRAALAAALLALAAGGCDKATPVAPSGTILQASANPTRIDVDGTSQITVIALRPNGTPVNPGTEIRFSTTLGTITDVVATDDSGVARATLRGDGRVGTATVTASSGPAESVTTAVEIGSLGGSITLQATPSTLPASGGRVTLLALVRDAQGQLLSSVAVNFQTEVGTLASGGGAVLTDAQGEARDTLEVTEADLGAVNAPTFTVRAQTAGAGGGLIERTFTIRIQSSAPIASFEAVDAGGCQIFFSNTSTGEEPLTFQWDFTNNGSVDSTERSPTNDYGSPGNFTVRMVATNANGSDTEIVTITVSGC